MRIGFSVVAAIVALANAAPFVGAAVRGANNLERKTEQDVRVYRDEHGDEVVQTGNVIVHVAQNGDEVIEIATAHNDRFPAKKSGGGGGPSPTAAPVPTAPTNPPAPTTPNPTPTGPDGNPSCDLCGGVDASGNSFPLDHVPSGKENTVVDTGIAGPNTCGGLEYIIGPGNGASPDECVQYQQNVGSTCCSNAPVSSALEAGIPASETASELEGFVLQEEGKEDVQVHTYHESVRGGVTSSVAGAKKNGKEEHNVQGRHNRNDACQCECAVPNCLEFPYVTSCEHASDDICANVCDNDACGGGGNLTQIVDVVPYSFEYEPTDEKANEFGYEVVP